MTSFKMAVHHGGELEFITASDGSERVFAANTNDSGIIENCIDFVQASVVRVYPYTWVGGIALRWEVYVDQDIGKNISTFKRIVP